MKSKIVILSVLALMLSACGESEAEKKAQAEANAKKAMSGVCNRALTLEELRRGDSCKK